MTGNMQGFYEYIGITIYMQSEVVLSVVRENSKGVEEI